MGGVAILLTATHRPMPLPAVLISRPYPDAEDLRALGRLLAEHRSAWVSCDGYHLDARYSESARAAGARVLVIDDVGDAALHAAHVLLNQNIGAERIPYPDRPGVIRLLGPRYALLRPDFDRWASWTRTIPRRAERVLVTMGGSDSRLQTRRLVRILDRVGTRLEVVVAVGGENPDLDAIRRAAAAADAVRFTVHVDVDRMPELMAWSDLVVSAAGSTAWELCCMGSPMVLLTVADNQRGIGEGLARIGAAVHAGDADVVDDDALGDIVQRVITDPTLRETLSANARRVVDGRGARRVCRILRGEPEESE